MYKLFNGINILNMLMDKDLLKTEGQGRGARYLLSDKFQDRLSISENKLGNNEDRLGNNEDKLGNSEKKLGIRNDISEDILKRIKEISLPAREIKRLDRVTMEKIIIELCSIKLMSVEELSELLQRDGSGIRKVYLSNMTKENKLKLLYPGQINHLKQAYLTNDTVEL